MLKHAEERATQDVTGDPRMPQLFFLAAHYVSNGGHYWEKITGSREPLQTTIDIRWNALKLKMTSGKPISINPTFLWGHWQGKYHRNTHLCCLTFSWKQVLSLIQENNVDLHSVGCFL